MRFYRTQNGSAVDPSKLYRLWHRASLDAPDVCVERFLVAWRGYIDALILQKHRTLDGYVWTIEEYMAVRRDDIGSYTCFAMLQITLGIDLPHEVTDHPFICSMERDIADMIVLSNVSLLSLISWDIQ